MLRLRIVPTRFQLDERYLVGRIAVDLVRAHVDEHCLTGVSPGALEQIDRPDRVHVEVVERNVARLVVGRLRCAVNDQFGRCLPEIASDGLPIANVDAVRREVPRFPHQPLQVPRRIALRPEELAPHVVVNAVDNMTCCIEMLHRL